jgi:hypothetical protein
MAKLPDRQARLSQALRENLKRRKVHARRVAKASIAEGEGRSGRDIAKGSDIEAPRPNPAEKNS